MADGKEIGESLPKKSPIVEVGPSSTYPHPKLDGMPEGVIGHPGEHSEHEPITHNGKTIAVPYAGHGEKVVTTPTEQDVERLLKENARESGHWLGAFLRRRGKTA